MLFNTCHQRTLALEEMLGTSEPNPHFTTGTHGPERVSDFSQATQLGNVHNLASWLPAPHTFCSTTTMGISCAGVGGVLEGNSRTKGRQVNWILWHVMGNWSLWSENTTQRDSGQHWQRASWVDGPSVELAWGRLPLWGQHDGDSWGRQLLVQRWKNILDGERIRNMSLRRTLRNGAPWPGREKSGLRGSSKYLKDPPMDKQINILGVALGRTRQAAMVRNVYSTARLT